MQALCGKRGVEGAQRHRDQLLDNLLSFLQQSAANPTEMQAMTKLLAANRRDISASVYTQIADVETECDGMLTYDRRSKFGAADTRRIREANAALISGARQG